VTNQIGRRARTNLPFVSRILFTDALFQAFFVAQADEVFATDRRADCDVPYQLFVRVKSSADFFRVYFLRAVELLSATLFFCHVPNRRAEPPEDTEVFFCRYLPSLLGYLSVEMI